MNNNSLSVEEILESKRLLNRKKRLLLLFTLPLLVFIFITFISPIATMLYRSVYHPTVSQLIPLSLAELKNWDEAGDDLPPSAALQQFAIELQDLSKQRLSGKLAEEVNRLKPGSSSLIKSSARKLKKKTLEELQENGDSILLSYSKKWHNIDLWRAVKRAGQPFTDSYYLTTFDLKRNPAGEIEQRDTQIYLKLYWKSLKIAIYITLLTALLAYPLAYYLATAPSKIANRLMVLVLLPFWTSLLVRTTSWIAILQTNGVLNSSLQSLGLIDEPFELLYTQAATIIAMTHILLPFMILPLYSVMKNIDPSYLRAALSLGARPIPAFIKIYLPMTVPGVSAGALLVFIISIGYYITPAIVGGTDGQMISNIIAFHMQSSNNWELAAALGSLLLALIIALYWIYDRLVGVNNIKLG
ncbi:ABC transporter permease [Agarivorans sp. 1_MG-2023]|uniref:ABC transporter permease n=1 Tax=Agarivorans sp. 1_MG-2023 TaxID=3062634 RepID=UPI0026E3EFF5|nr:ABC transporter permease [Agarivorans sp. 1_MG-2023]MDO6764354.1 ABC transporter permease [Agarivorans sp. 1_MG-2023]